MFSIHKWFYQTYFTSDFSWFLFTSDFSQIFIHKLFFQIYFTSDFSWFLFTSDFYSQVIFIHKWFFTDLFHVRFSWFLFTSDFSQSHFTSDFSWFLFTSDFHRFISRVIFHTFVSRGNFHEFFHFFQFFNELIWDKNRCLNIVSNKCLQIITIHFFYKLAIPVIWVILVISKNPIWGHILKLPRWQFPNSIFILRFPSM